MNTMSYHERTCRYLITECLMSTSSLSESQFSDDWKEMIHFYSTGYASWVIIEIFELWSWEIMELVSYQSLCVGVFMPTWCLQTSRSFPWTWSEDVMLVFIYTLKSTIVWHRFQMRSESAKVSRIRVDLINTSGSLVVICVPLCLQCFALRLSRHL